eukprot:4727171-Alexandrium_andersonii.AAC.1
MYGPKAELSKWIQRNLDRSINILVALHAMHCAVLAEATLEREQPVVNARLREERKAPAEALDALAGADFVDLRRMQALGGGVVLVPADVGAVERFLLSQKWAVAHGMGVSWLELTL